jgi:hypothetical protein
MGGQEARASQNVREVGKESPSFVVLPVSYPLRVCVGSECVCARSCSETRREEVEGGRREQEQGTRREGQNGGALSLERYEYEGSIRGRGRKEPLSGHWHWAGLGGSVSP